MAIVVGDRDEAENTAGGLAKTGTAGTGPLAGGGTATATPGQPKAYTKSNFTSGRMILDKNQNSAQPDLAKGLEQRAQGAQQNVQTQAQTYNQGLADRQKQYTLGGDDFSGVATGRYGEARNADQQRQAFLSRAVSADGNEFSRVQSLLQGPADEAAKFETSTGLNQQDINALNSSAGVASQIRNQMAGQGRTDYTRGQANLDAQLFGRSAEGRQAQVARAQSATDAANKFAFDQMSAADQARTQTEDRIRQEREGIRGDVTNIQQGIARMAQQRADDLNKKYTSKEYRTKAVEKAQKQGEKEISRVAKAEAGGDKNLERMIKEDLMAQLKGGKFTSFKAKTLKGPAYDDAQAAQFNRISGLLGTGDNAQATDLSGYGGEAGINTSQITRNIKRAKELAQQGLLVPPKQEQDKLFGGTVRGNIREADRLNSDMASRGTFGADQPVRDQIVDPVKTRVGLKRKDNTGKTKVGGEWQSKYNPTPANAAKKFKF
jgi:hypothetical protein